MIRFNNLKIFINAGEAKPGGNIGAMLSPYLFSTNMSEFCKRFNDQSKDFINGVLMSVHLYCNIVEKTYSFIIRNLSISFFITYLLSLNYKISITMFFDIIKYFAMFFKFSLYNCALIIFSILRSFRRRKSLFFFSKFLKKKYKKNKIYV